MRYTETTDDSAVSPVIGVILMVAITVILAAVIGTFVLGLGENVEGTAQAAVTVEQDDSSFVVSVTDTGNVDTAGIIAPDGTRSAFGSTDDVVAAGANLRVAQGGNWDRAPSEGGLGAAITSDNTTGALVINDATSAGGGATSDLTTTANATNLQGIVSAQPSSVEQDGVELADQDDLDELNVALDSAGVNECYLSHGANTVSGVVVQRADIGCTGLALATHTIDAADGGAGAGPLSGALTISNAGEANGIDTGGPIQYENDASYSFVGTVDGSENELQSFTTTDS